MVFITLDAIPISIILFVLLVLFIRCIRLIKFVTMVDGAFLLIFSFRNHLLLGLGRDSLPQVIASIMLFYLLPQLQLHLLLSGFQILITILFAHQGLIILRQ